MRSWVTERRFGLETQIKRLDDEYFAKLGLKRRELVLAFGGFQGELVFPFSTSYDKDRQLHNKLFDYYPLLIAYCISDSDVAWCLKRVREFRLPFRVRAGGHSSAGYSAVSGGIVIDVSRMANVSVDLPGQTMTVGAGATFKTINQTLENNNAHIPGSECDDVAIGGHMQGGGYGLTSRTFGMHCDNVLSARVMLADCTIVQASPWKNADLYWAVRGGTGNNFGVLLSVTYRIQQLDTVYGWRLRWPITTAAQRNLAANAAVAAQTLFTTAPPEFNIQVAVLYPETDDGSDPEAQLWVYGIYVGTQAQGQASIADLRALPGAVFDFEEQGKYSSVLEDLTHPWPAFPSGDPDHLCEVQISRYTSLANAGFWTSARWQQLLAMFIVPVDDRWNYFFLEAYGGAINTYPAEQSAFIHRDKLFNACLDVFWNEQDQRGNPGGGRYGSARQLLTDWSNFVAPAWDGEIYQNYPEGMPDGTDYALAYWGAALPALMAVKRKYDPNRLFDFPQAIPDRPAPVAWPPAVATALGQPIQP